MIEIGILNKDTVFFETTSRELLLITIKLSTVNFYRKTLFQCKILDTLLCYVEMGKTAHLKT